MKYHLAIYKNDSEGYSVTVADMPGCISYGDTLDLAVDNAQEAITLHLEGLAEDGDELPLGRSLDELQKDPAFVRATVWSVVDVDLTPYLGGSVKLNITLPKLLIEQIDRHVSSGKARSRSGFLADVARDRLRLV